MWWSNGGSDSGGIYAGSAGRAVDALLRVGGSSGCGKKVRKKEVQWRREEEEEEEDVGHGVFRVLV